MKPFEKLTDKEKEMIEHYISNYSDSSFDIGCCRQNLDYVLRFWNINKEHLFHKFGDELIIEKEFTYSQSKGELLETMSSEYYNILNGFINKCRDVILQSYGTWSTVLYTEDKYHIINRKTSEKVENDYYASVAINNIFHSPNSFINNTLSFKELGNGCYNKNYRYFIDLANGKSVELIDGMKFNKVLKKISESYGIDGYEEYRITQSLVNNQRRIKGTLCLSIHPLDYMTMSDNNSGWSSCMSWSEYGEFRQGTVEMMNSPYVIVAYLKSDKKSFYIKNEEWSNKKWRMLILAADDRITTIKSYPFFNEELSTTALNFAKSILTKGEEWDDTLYITSSSLADPSFLGNLSKEYPILHNVMYESNIMYNDFYTTNHFCYKQNIKDNSLVTLNYSGETECVWCGEEISSEPGNDIETCLRCHSDTRGFCESCGAPLHEDEICWGDDGYPYCEDCFYEYFDFTIFANDVIDKNSAKIINITNKEGETIASGYDFPDRTSYPFCFGVGNVYRNEDDGEWFIPITDLNEKGLSYLRLAPFFYTTPEFIKITEGVNMLEGI